MVKGGNEWILSFITLQNIEMFGLDLYLKYLLNNNGDEVTVGYSHYGTGRIDNKKTSSSLEKGNDFFVANAMLETETGDFDPFSDLVFFNAPEHKIFMTYLNNSLLKNGFFEFALNYKSKFDFILLHLFRYRNQKLVFFIPIHTMPTLGQ